MGEPNKVLHSHLDEDSSEVIYYYEPPFMASGDIEIILAEDSTVVQILPYEGT
ncbi:MAG: hypothetical protein AAF223_14270 [Bacteroidota bacterium]